LYAARKEKMIPPTTAGTFLLGNIFDLLDVFLLGVHFEVLFIRQCKGEALDRHLRRSSDRDMKWDRASTADSALVF
jgi:hypothetical protein